MADIGTEHTTNLDFLTAIDPIDTTSLAEKVELKLIKFFLDHKLKPGDSIPKEMDLANALGVSRTVIREALIRLKLTGLIETKKKRGAVLTNPDLLSLLQKTLYPGFMDDGTLKDMFEIRMVMEIGMADLIMQRIVPEDITELKSIVKNEPSNTNSLIFDIEQEVRFHGKLYDITGNQTLKRFQQLLLPVFKFVHESGLLKKNTKNKLHVSHKKIVDVVQHGTAKELREAMRNHFENQFQRLF